MLSVENPSDPLVSCKASALKSDESASDKLAFQEAADPEGLDEAKPPHFSIRDYVFNSRSKDVTKNWPFPHKFLQLCLEYGVKDILPPFEPPDLVRAQRCRRGAEYEHPITCSNSERISAEFKSLEPKNGGQIIDEEPNIIRHELCLPLDQFVVECPDQAQDLFSKSRKSKVNHKILSGDELITIEAEPISTITSHDQIERVSGQISKLPSTVNATKSATEGSSELEVDERPLLPEKFEVRREPSEKKCKLIGKLSSTSEATRVEDIVSTSSTVSDPMASKVCPVCKTFTSTSNTTLNAHIDQCLSQESNTKRVVTKLSKLKVKPRKKRLMVDIYTTAPHCTLEDLDIRNGTNWATDVTLAAPTSEFRTEMKRAKLSVSGATNDGNEGAVYVDSNGMKLRILSKFNDVPPVISEDFKLRKHVKGIKAGRSSLISKKKCFKPKYSKCKKINQRSKRLRSFKLFKGKAQVTQIGDCHSNTYKEKEESLSCILNVQDQVKCHNPGTLRQQVCSKRSGPSRKLNKKGTLRNIENTVPSTLDTFVEGETSVEGSQPNPANSSVVERHILKLSSSSEDLPSSPKTKRVDVLSNSVHATYIGKARPLNPLESNSRLSPENISLASGLLPKLPRASSNFVSSPRSKREEIHLSTIHKSDSSSDITTASAKCCLPSLKTRKRFSPKKNVSLGKSSSVVVSKSDDSEKRLTARMFRKHRSILGVGKRGGKLPSGINGELHGSTEDFGFEYSPRANGTGNAYQPNFSEDITISRVLESEQEKEGFCAMAKHESAKKKMLLEADCCAFDVEASDMQHEPLGYEDIANEHSMDKDVDERGGGANLIVKHSTPALNAGVDPWPSGQEHAESFCGSEAPVEGGLIDEQVVQCYDVASNKIINKNIEKVIEKGNLFRVMQSEDQTNTSIKGFSTCLIGHVDVVLESAQKNSSITSVKMASSEDHNLAGCTETSAASASTSSNFSLPSPEVSKSKNTYEEQCVELTAGQGKLSSCLLDNSELPSIVSVRGTEGGKKERRDQEVKGVAMAKELEKLSDDQLCCCSRKERFSQESPQLLRKSSKTNSMLPSKGKQVASNLCIRPIISSSSSALHSLSTGEMSVPILESSTESILINVCPSDFASELPPGSDFGPSSPYSLGQDQAASNPILRLMGKDLVVKNKELAELPEVFPPDSDYASTMKYVPLGFTSSNSGLGKISFSHQQCQIPSGSTFLGKTSSKAKQQTSGFVGVSSMKSQQKRAKKLHSPLPCSIEKMAASQHHQRPISTAPAPYRDVIVIDGSPDVEAKVNRSMPTPVVALPPAFPGSNLIPPRLFSCFPTKNTDMSGEVPGMVKPSYSISYTMANACTPVKHDSASEGSVPPSSFVFQPLSRAHLTPSLYSSQTLQ